MTRHDGTLAVTLADLSAFWKPSFPRPSVPGARTPSSPSVRAQRRCAWRRAKRNCGRAGPCRDRPMMGLADVAVYVALLGQIGLVPLAVTTNLSINFLRKPPPGDLFADARLIKLGKRMAVGDVGLRGPQGGDWWPLRGDLFDPRHRSGHGGVKIAQSQRSF